MSRADEFKVINGREAREVYGLTAAKRPPISLRSELVPEQFRCWIPLAEHWGVSDDCIREDLVRAATDAELLELLAFGDAYEQVLDQWLAGPEASRPPSPEYVAFSALGMAWESASLLARRSAAT